MSASKLQAASGINVTGTSDLAPIESQADVLKDILILAKIPMIAGEEGLCEALGITVPDDYEALQ